MSQPSNPPLLLTKRLTQFLQSSRTPSLPTLLLTNPAGRLLAHASPDPVSKLRTYATVAGSLFSIHTYSSSSLQTALPGEPPEVTDDEESGEEEEEEGSELEERRDSGRRRHTKPETITVQLSGGVVVVKRLRCGLLFVCVGPTLGEGGSQESTQQGGSQGDDLANELMNATISPGDSSSTSLSPTAQPSSSHHTNDASPHNGTPKSVTASTVDFAAVVSLKEQATELAGWLDDKLGQLSVPEEGVGVDL